MNGVTKNQLSDIGLESEYQHGLILKTIYIQINRYKNKCRCMCMHELGHIYVFPSSSQWEKPKSVTQVEQQNK